MIVVHHLENSRSQRVVWLLEELGLEYEIRHYRRDPQTMLAPPELRAVHPLGKSPVITDGGPAVAESGAIIEYLIERHDNAGTLAPPTGSPERLRYTYWLHYAEGSAMPPLLLSLVFSRVKSAPMPFFIRPIANGIADKVLKTFVRPQIRTHFDYVESELAARPWFAGAEFSAADIQMSFPLEAAVVRGGVGEGRPHLVAWLEKIRQRPAFQRAVQRGGELKLPG